MVTKIDGQSEGVRLVRYLGEFFTISFLIRFDNRGYGYGVIDISAVPKARHKKSPDPIRRNFGAGMLLDDPDSFVCGLILGWSSAYPEMNDIVHFIDNEG